MAGERRNNREARAPVGMVEDGTMSGRHEGGVDGACISMAFIMQEAKLFPWERLRFQ